MGDRLMDETVLEMVNRLIHTIELGNQLTQDEKIEVRRVAMNTDSNIEMLTEIAWQYEELCK